MHTRLSRNNFDFAAGFMDQSGRFQGALSRAYDRHPLAHESLNVSAIRSVRNEFGSNFLKLRKAACEGADARRDDDAVARYLFPVEQGQTKARRISIDALDKTAIDLRNSLVPKP